MTATENTAPAPTVSGGEGWEEAAKIKLLDWFGKDFGFDFDDAWESAEQALALIAVARGGCALPQPSASSVPGGGKSETGGLTLADQKAQAARCGCRGSDDYCPCQNSPDQRTLKERGQ